LHATILAKRVPLVIAAPEVSRVMTREKQQHTLSEEEDYATEVSISVFVSKYGWLVVDLLPFRSLLHGDGDATPLERVRSYIIGSRE
jgi:hypothetical protein